MWLISVNDSIRLISTCAIAPRMPISMVSSAAHSSTFESLPSGKSSVSVRMMA
jgi:hypothetical protein